MMILKDYTAKNRNKRMSILTSSFQYYTGSPIKYIQQEKGNLYRLKKRILSLFADDMIIFVQNKTKPKKAQKF